MKLSANFRTVATRFGSRSGTPVSPISIVVPALNAAATIERMLYSVLAQTSDAWELVIVDDGSTDRTRAIVEAATRNHPIRVIDGPQQGVSAARNAGTDDARFDHVLYLDADDWIGAKFVGLNLEAETLAGTMAVAVPMDVDLAGLIPSHPADLTKDITAHHLAGAIHEAVAFGSCSLLDEWPELYPRHMDRITEMLDALADWLEQPELTRERSACSRP